MITYPQAVEEGANSYVQMFSQGGVGGVGGGKIIYNFGVDARGMMTVVEQNSYAGRPVSNTVWAWNGKEYAAAAPKAK